MNKANQSEYIKYLEERIQKLTENTAITNQDLSTLVDAQNEVIVDSASSLKNILGTGSNYTNQFALLQNKLVASDLFIEYLTNSIWWKLSSPFRHLSRLLKNHKSYAPFDFSDPSTIQEKVCAIIYVGAFTGALEEQIANLQKQKYFASLEIILIDFSNSNKLSVYAKANNLTYISLKATNNDFDLANSLIDKNAKYVVYLEQGIYDRSQQWLFKLIYPITKSYTNLSVLYRNTDNIKHIKKHTFFRELQSRIITIGKYECLYLPMSRDSVQYIPFSVIDNASAIAKRRN